MGSWSNRNVCPEKYLRGVEGKDPVLCAGFCLRQATSNRTRRVLVHYIQYVVAPINATVCQKMREGFSLSSVRPQINFKAYISADSV